MSILRAALASALFALCASGAAADDLTTYSITLKNHHFTPAEIHVPTGKPFQVIVTNDNGASDEFEMLLPPVERAIQPGQQGVVRMRPLGPGRFPFFGEADPDSEQGAFISE